MDKIIITDIIIERCMMAFNVRNKEQLSILLGISPSNFSAQKRRGTLTKLIEKEARKRNISYDWIITGQGSMIPGGVREAEDPYQSTIPEHIPSKVEESPLDMTAYILSTDSVYRSALESNLKAFRDAVTARQQLAVAEAKLAQLQRENIELKQRLNEKDKLLEDYRVIISELRAGKSDAGGV